MLRPFINSSLEDVDKLEARTLYLYIQKQKQSFGYSIDITTANHIAFCICKSRHP